MYEYEEQPLYVVGEERAHASEVLQPLLVLLGSSELVCEIVRIRREDYKYVVVPPQLLLRMFNIVIRDLDGEMDNMDFVVGVGLDVLHHIRSNIRFVFSVQQWGRLAINSRLSLRDAYRLCPTVVEN